jgi:Leucine rich repeat/Leucine Rich repeat
MIENSTNPQPAMTKTGKINRASGVRRCLPRIGIRGFMVLVLCIGGGLGWEMHRVKVQRDAVKALFKVGGLRPDYQWVWERSEQSAISDPPWWMLEMFGPDFFGNVVAIRQDPSYVEPVIDDDLMAHISRLSHLKVLNLDGLSSLTDDHLAYLAGLSRLETLFLSKTGVKGPGFVHLKGLSRLRYLSLGEIPLEDDDLAHISKIVSLTDLSSYNCKGVTDVGLAHLQGLVNLEELSLVNGSEITTRGLDFLKNMKKLSLLWLTYSKVDSIEPLAHLRGLTCLRLHKNRLTDAGLKPISGFKNLTYLFLSCEQISDDSMKAIGNLESLQWLDVSSTEITDAGLTPLINLRNLRTLELNETRIGDTGLLSLAGLPACQVIDLKKTPVTQEGIDAFRTIRPTIVIRRW